MGHERTDAATREGKTWRLFLVGSICLLAAVVYIFRIGSNKYGYENRDSAGAVPIIRPVAFLHVR